MNKIQRVSNCAGATVLQEERCVKEIHQKYQDIGTAGLLLVQACVTWADKIGEAAFLALARQGRLPFGETRAHRLLTVGRREDILIAAQRGKLQDRYSVMYEAALIPKEDLAHAIKHKFISKISGSADLRSVKDKAKGNSHEGSYTSTEAQGIAERTGSKAVAAMTNALPSASFRYALRRVAIFPLAPIHRV